MSRKKRRPKRGSKKIHVYSVPQKCKVCGYTWIGTEGKKTAKKIKFDSNSVEVNLLWY